MLMVTVSDGCVCEAGWQGQDCSRPCDEGMFGVNCSHVCRCENNATCQLDSGLCLCPPGFTGRHCQHSKSAALCCIVADYVCLFTMAREYVHCFAASKECVFCCVNRLCLLYVYVYTGRQCIYTVAGRVDNQTNKKHSGSLLEEMCIQVDSA